MELIAGVCSKFKKRIKVLRQFLGKRSAVLKLCADISIVIEVMGIIIFIYRQKNKIRQGGIIV